MVYSSIADLPSQVKLSLSEGDQRHWMDAYNSRDPQNEVEARDARRFAWMACKDRPSSFSFSAVGSVERWDKDKEKIDVDSLLKSMDRYIDSGGPISYEHRNYTCATCWAYEPFTKDGKKAMKIWGNVFGGDGEVYDNIRKMFGKILKGVSVAGESSGKRYECDRDSCGFHRDVSELLEIALCKVPANDDAMIIEFNEKAANGFAKSAGDAFIKFTDLEVHRDETTCPILSLRKSLRESGIDAHAREDGVFIPMSSSEFAKSIGSMRGSGLCVEWTDGGALVRDRDSVLESLFREGFEKGVLSEDGVLDDSDYAFFSKACGMGLLERKDGRYRLVDPDEEFEKSEPIVHDIKDLRRTKLDARMEGNKTLDDWLPGKDRDVKLTTLQEGHLKRLYNDKVKGH